IHGIIVLTDAGAGLRPAPTPSVRTRRHGLPEIVRAFKSFSSRRLNAHFGTPGARLRQRNYYEHVIRTEDDLNRIRQYIYDNPLTWNTDEYNPNRRP
ncbi:MAG TPA: transposase, partial [Dehalococcoidia bacterium]|nr:transposase [Dehalococcoidia bacterium]